MQSNGPPPVVVITGASSGIGRATACEFAQRGAAVVLAARREDALREAADECHDLGGRALVVPADVTDERSVYDLARRTGDVFGRMDAWVNNAAVSMFGRFEEVPLEHFRRVVETNLLGCVYGMRAALPYFRKRGRGVLVNVGSVLSHLAEPFTSAYIASKFALKGLSECVRMELELDGAGDIHVCAVLPASIDTPIFQQAANYLGRAVKPVSPVYPAEQVARAIAGVVEDPRREVVVGGAGRLAIAVRRLSPALFERFGAPRMAADHFEDHREIPNTGNLYEPMPQHARVGGGWRPHDEVWRAGRWTTLAAVAAGTALAVLVRTRI